MPNNDLQGRTLGPVAVPLKSNATVSAANFQIFQSVTTLDTYLLTQGYTQTTLDKMTKNDKVNAARLKLGYNHI